MFSLDEALFLIWGGIRQIWELKMARVLCTRMSTNFTCAQDGASLLLEQCVGSQMVPYTFWLNGEMVKCLKYPLLVGANTQHILSFHLVRVFQVNEKPTE